MTLPTISHQWVLGSVTKNLLSMTVLLTPALVRRELQRPAHSRFHRAREREMLYRLGVTGCGSRVALSEMLRGLAEKCSQAASLSSQKILRPGPYRPNVPICRYGCRVVPASGLARSWGWRSEPLDLSPPIFYVFPCAAWGASGAGSGRPLLLPYWTRSTPSFAPPGGVRLLPLPYWMRSTTPPPILPPTSGLARRRWRRGAQLDGELAFYASRRRLWALPGGGGGG